MQAKSNTYISCLREGLLSRRRLRGDSAIPKYSKRHIAFCGLMTCANDDCMMTGDVQKKKYAYYRCTGYRGKCELPRFREEDLSLRLGESLKGLQVPANVVARIVTALRDDEKNSVGKVDAERSRRQGRLTNTRNRIDQAYTDKLDGTISEEFWRRKTNDWRLAEEQVKMALNALGSAQTRDQAMNAKKIFELANKAYLIFQRAKAEEWSALVDVFRTFSGVPQISTTSFE